jgi:glutamate dehydrogenase (NADP+)
MDNIYAQCRSASETYGLPGNLAAGANIAGFLRIAEAMTAQGIV